MGGRAAIRAEYSGVNHGGIALALSALAIVTVQMA
jgi:hypothetical protein